MGTFRREFPSVHKQTLWARTRVHIRFLSELVPFYTRMGKDRQGKWRGKCTASDCDCALYTKDDPKDKLRCDYCDHVPGSHALLGKCLGCEQCESYEVDDEEELDGKGECSYCSCDAEKHG